MYVETWKRKPNASHVKPYGMLHRLGSSLSLSLSLCAYKCIAMNSISRLFGSIH